MISEEQIIQEFIRVVSRLYPLTGQLLYYCYVKVVGFYVPRLRKRFSYLTIYCPNELLSALRSQEEPLKEIAETMELIDVVFIKADNLLRDPMSKLKQENPRFWLELHWVISRH